jgi:hypothetical protein
MMPGGKFLLALISHRRFAMRYMMLIYSTEVDMTTVPRSEYDKVAAAHGALLEETAKRGILVGANPLQGTNTATTVRHRNGEVVTFDGPFAETKEQLAGYYILDCADLDEAVAWAARIPTGCFGGSGCVEIRPLRSKSQDLPEPQERVAAVHD